MFSFIRPTLLGFCALGFFSTLSFAENFDLNRIQPVPKDQRIPTVDFFRPPQLLEPKLNLAGTDIAALVAIDQEHYGLMLYDLKKQKVDVIGAGADCDIHDFGWLGDNRLFYMVTSEKLYGLGMYGVAVNSFHHSYPLLQYLSAQIVGIPPGHEAYPLVWARYDALNNGTDRGVVVVDGNLESGIAVNLRAAGADNTEARQADDANQRHIRQSFPTAPGGLGRAYYTARTGNLAYGITETNGYDSLYQLDGDHWTKCPIDLDATEFITSGNDPDQGVIIGPRQEGKPRTVQIVNTKNGALGEVLLQDEAYDFTGYLYRDPVSHAIVGAYFERNGPRSVWFDPGYAQLQHLLDGYFPKLSVRLLGSDRTGHLFLVSVRSDRQSPIYYMVNLEAKTIGLIKSSRPWLDPQRMQTMNILKYKTRDGRKMDAYLTLPAGASKEKPAPLIVLPHGGPWVRDNWGFDVEAQFFANRGYAVLQPNYRGSPGYDWMFPEDDRWDFVKMHNDVTDAAKAVIASGYVDPKRVAIMGGSFGGYLALSGVEREPGLYVCGVTVAGVFDWEALIREKKYDRYSSSEYNILMRRLGDPAKQKEKFAEISPLRHVDEVHVPMFVSHGTEDPRVDVGESRSLISELERNHVPVEKFIASGEGHGMHHLEPAVELYDRIDAFLAKYLSPERQ